MNKMKHRCLQSKCGFLNAGIGCKKCDKCETSPYLINNECKRCLKCQDEEGELRWEDGNEQEEKQEQGQEMMIRA